MSAPIVKFKTPSYDAKIEPIECVRETAKQLVVLTKWRGEAIERKVAKSSSYENYHDTWEEAHAFLMGKAKRDVENARHNLEQANGALGNIKGMKKPGDSK